jgi:hypothetical protein
MLDDCVFVIEETVNVPLQETVTEGDMNAECDRVDEGELIEVDCVSENEIEED